DAVPGQRQVHAVGTKRRQYVTAADIREKADSDLRHGELGLLCQNPVRAVEGDAHTATHDDAVDQGQVGLAIALDMRVKPIFLGEEGDRRRLATATRLIDLRDVPARAECPPL